VHSILSDGGKDFSELAGMYAEAGYDFLTRIDHWVCSDAAADPVRYPLLWLDGIELDGKDYTGSLYHVICLGRFRGITPELGFIGALEEIRRQNGILILAPPAWIGNTIEDANRWQFHGVEAYNNICQRLSGKADSYAYWNAMLLKNPDVIGIGSDDAHLRGDSQVWNGAWVHVNAPHLTREALLDSIRKGRFYSSQGPQFLGFAVEGDEVVVQCSPVRWIRLVGPTMHGRRRGSTDGPLVTEARFQIPTVWEYVYLEIEDEQGRRAWTNTLFTDIP